MFGCQHGRAPQYLIDYCLPVSDVASRQHLRSASRRLLVVPRHRLGTFGRRAFAVAGPTVWNSLPDNLRDTDVTIQLQALVGNVFVFSVSLDVLRRCVSTNLHFTCLLTYLLTCTCSCMLSACDILPCTCMHFPVEGSFMN